MDVCSSKQNSAVEDLQFLDLQGFKEKLRKADPSILLHNSSNGRTCLHAVVSRGDADLLKYLLSYIKDKLPQEKGDLIREKDKQGNTVLHLAVRRNRLDMVTQLLEFERALASSLNRDDETPIYVAVKLGFLLLVQELVNRSPESIEIASKKDNNILHLAVELSQAKILKFLVKNKKVDLSKLINQPDSTQSQKGENQSVGDTPLHIAARNKNVYMVDWLLKVNGVNKDSVNSAGLTPLDIARENTEYHEPYKIIEKLSTYPPRCRPFLYSAPTMSVPKQKKGGELLDKLFDDRRNVELVVATLLATMTFTAVFTVPGGFSIEQTFVLGAPVLIGYESFKLFLIFDCLAFFLSLFVVLMWVMSSPFTARDKMLFIYLTNAVMCIAFAFTAYSMVAAVYTVLVHKAKLFAAIVLGLSTLIAVCGSGAFFYIAAKFTVRRARFHRLCGVPRRLDDMVEKCWVMAEKWGIMDIARAFDDVFHGLISGDIDWERLRNVLARREKGQIPIESEGGDKSPSSWPLKHDPNTRV